jgi:hypothetical protein
MKQWQIILIALIMPVLITFGCLYYIFNFVSLDLFSQTENKLGSTITTINGSDKIKDLPTTLNANFNALNNTKIENSSTTISSITTLPSLSSIGTITTGLWHGATLTVGYGGTGSSSLVQYGLLLGNGTSAVTTVSGYGTSGQFLTSTGTGTPPVWQSASVNQTVDYSWTGQHTFGATTTMATTTVNSLVVASSTLTRYPSASSSIASKGYVDQTSAAYSSGSIASSTGLGDMVIIHNLGATPRYIKITSTFGQLTNDFQNSWSYGVATGTAVTSQNYITRATVNGSANWYSLYGQGYVIYLHDTSGAPGGTLKIGAALSAVNNTSFTLNFSVFAANRSVYILWEAYK